MKRTRDELTADVVTTKKARTFCQEQVSNLAILYEYVRQSGLYNMLYPVEEARMAAAAVIATGVYLGHPMDWNFLSTTPTWLTLVQNEYKANAAKLAAAARALPGGNDFIDAAKPGRGFVASTVRARLTSRDIIQEAVDECTQWATYASTEEPVRGYRAVLDGAQRLDKEKRLAPRVEKKPRLGPVYVSPAHSLLCE
jgi:hypothetical protein